jgi:hypothetical protein
MPPLGPLGKRGNCGARFLRVVLDGVVMMKPGEQAADENFASRVRRPLCVKRSQCYSHKTRFLEGHFSVVVDGFFVNFGVLD